MNRKARTTLMAMGISLAAAVATQARADEQSYYKGKSWEVLLKTTDAAGEAPYCALRSTNLAEKSVAIEYNLTGIDETTPSLRIIKRNWGLPIGQATKVAVSTRWAGGVGFDATVLNSDELYGEFPQQSAGDRGFMLVNILGTVIRTVKPAPLVVVFEGNEPMWLVPSVDFGEAMSLGSEFKDCLTALKKLGPSLYNTAETSKTSPFNKQPGQSGFNFGITPGNSNPPFQTSPEASKTVELAPPASSWTFEKRDEDWGETCYVETTHGATLIGFMGAPGKDLVAFVENGFTGSVTTTWKVDGGGSYVSDGDVSDYSGWHEFYGLPKDILTNAKNGKQLTVSDTDGKTIALDLSAASDALSQFIQCFGK